MSIHRSFGEHLGRPKIAHGSHNDVRRLCWPDFRDIHGLQLVKHNIVDFKVMCVSVRWCFVELV